MNPLEIAARFCLDGTPVSCAPTGMGHINRTYIIVTDSGRRYIQQAINHLVFRDVDGLMRNIIAVTEHLKKKTDDPRGVLSFARTKEGASYILAEDGRYYRVMDYVENSICLQQAADERDFYRAAAAFGEFQNLLSDFPAQTLTETIPRFHDTPDRYRQFHEALSADARSRADGCRKEIDFVLTREKDAGVMVDMMRQGALPLRVTHNDTKLNNVLFDADTRLPLCVIDLDTVMPGLAGNDFGDAIRFGASTAVEDEQDLSRVHFSLPLFRAFTEGYLEKCGRALTQAEKDTLPLASRLMTLEVGLRFLTDYLMGDTYFGIQRKNHNLDRARTQFKLLSEMEEKQADTRRIVRETCQTL